MINIMSKYQEILNNMIPFGLTSSSNKQSIINITYANNVGNNLLVFIQDLKKNIMRKNNGQMMCPPRITWKTVGFVKLNCMDNLFLYGALGNSAFLKIVNTYGKNIQIHKQYLYMKSQGKSYPKPIKPQ